MIFEIPIDHFPGLCQSNSLDEPSMRQKSSTTKLPSVTHALARSAFCLSTMSLGEQQPVPVFDLEDSSARTSRQSSICGEPVKDKRDLFRRANSAPQLLKSSATPGNSPTKKDFPKAESHSNSVISLPSMLLKRFRHLAVE